jgi:DNA-binding CsgD family transcriptional regulator
MLYEENCDQTQEPRQDEAFSIRPFALVPPRVQSPGATSDSHWAVFKTALNMLDQGALVCDEAARLRTGNDAGLAILAERDGLTLLEGAIHVQDSRLRAELRSILLDGPKLEKRREADPPGRALLIPRASRRPSYQIVVRRLPDEPSIAGFGLAQLWAMVISDPCNSSRQLARTVSALYGLTPAETRLVDLLMCGATPDEIAAQTNLKMPTVRSQLSSIFAKTGTRRQAELVRLFSNVPAFRATDAIELS